MVRAPAIRTYVQISFLRYDMGLVLISTDIWLAVPRCFNSSMCRSHPYLDPI